jgi:hypothetical protein
MVLAAPVMGIMVMGPTCGGGAGVGEGVGGVAAGVSWVVTGIVGVALGVVVGVAGVTSGGITVASGVTGASSGVGSTGVTAGTVGVPGVAVGSCAKARWFNPNNTPALSAKTKAVVIRISIFLFIMLTPFQYQ